MFNVRRIAEESSLSQISHVLVIVFLSWPLKMTAVLFSKTATLQDLLALGIILQDFLEAGELEYGLVFRCRSIDEVKDAGRLAWGRLEPADMRI